MLSRAVWERFGQIWACDSSLEPLRLPYEQVMGEICFARRAPAVCENVFRSLYKNGDAWTDLAVQYVVGTVLVNKNQ